MVTTALRPVCHRLVREPGYHTNDTTWMSEQADREAGRSVDVCMYVCVMNRLWVLWYRAAEARV